MSHGGLGIEHLEDVEPIEPGGTGDLFTARDRKLGRRVLVRVLSAEASEGDRVRFLGLARALAGRASHPNLATVYDAGTAADGRPYVVTELVDGPDLASVLDTSGPLPWPEAIELVLQLAGGLEQIHQAGSRHRDLRPENVAMAGSAPKMTDVGLLPMSGVSTETPLTLAHRAPETLAGDGDERSDLYSLVSVLYRLIDGRAPFWRPADTAESLRARLETQTAPPLDPDLVPPALAVFVTAGLSSDPLDRPQHVGEFIGELRLIAEGRVTGSTPSVLHATSASPTAIPVVPATTATSPANGPVDDTAVQPSWTLDTAELAALDGQGEPLVPAGLWAPPGQGAATGRHEPAPATQESTMFAMANPAMETVPPSFGAPPAPDAGRASVFGSEPAFEPGPIPPPTDDHTTLIPTFDVDAAGPKTDPARPPLVVAAVAMIALGLVGLLAVVAIGLRGSGNDAEVTAPVLPDPNAPTEAGDGQPLDGLPTTLTPLAMLPESTTTTLSDEMVTSTDTTVRRVVVPNLVGLDVSVAGQRLSDEGFEVLVVGRVSPGSVPGTVIQQTPANGSTIELPATVTLFIPRSATLPAMVGRPADTVCLQLTALGLRCEQTLRFNDQVAPGAVIATTPTEGSAFTDGQSIRVDVSRGPLTEARIPPVTGMNENEARTTLGNAGFVTLSTTNVASANIPAGQVIGTDPAAGTSLTVDQPIVIQVSSGPAPVVVIPEIIGLERAAAEAALQQANLTGNYTIRELPAGDPNIGRVLDVEPDQGTQVNVGSTVTVVIGQAAETGTTTTAPSMTTTTAAADGG